MRILILLFILFLSSNLIQGQGFVIKSKNKHTNPTPRPNEPPAANAGADKSIKLPTDAVTFFGSGADPEAQTLSYLWTQTGGPLGAAMTGEATATMMAGSLIEGTYNFLLTVTDNLGLTAIDSVSVVVNAADNDLPVANAGSDQIITLPTNTVSLSGSGTDGDGTITAYQWKYKSGPASSVISSPNTANTDILFAESGVYAFQLQVTDNLGAVGFNEVQVTVQAEPSAINNGAITFSLDTISHVSAGVFTHDADSTLIATLFSDSVMSAGSHTVYWRGLSDTLGTIQFPATRYIAKVLSNNVKYTWKGTIGNNSDSVSGDTKHRGYYRCMSTLCFWGDFGYYGTGYSEGSPSLGKFNIATPGTKISMPYGPLINTGDIGYNCTDGTYVYWGIFDSNQSSYSGIFATKITDDSEVAFAAGQVFQSINGRDYPYAIGISSQAGAKVTGMAVSSYLFAARAGVDRIDVYNKTTGAQVQTIVMDSARALATDQSGNLWAISGAGTVAKYPVNANGTIGAAVLTLSGLSWPLSVNVNPAGTIVTVEDGGASQQVKHFNNSTGALSTTVGDLGGFANGATVTNSKFYLTDIDGVNRGENQKYFFVAYQPDGSYWANDPGNYRVQKYNTSHAYVRRLQWLGSSLSTSIDPNDISRVFYKYLEFDMDYETGAWDLVKNWQYKISTNIYNTKYDNKPKTLSNGRTYGLFVKGNTAEILEFAGTGLGDSVRPTNIFKSPGYFMEPNGDLIRYLRGAYGGTSSMIRYSLTGFTGAGNPTWAASPTTLFTTPVLTKFDPNGFPRTGGSIITSTGKVVTFDAGAGIINNRNVIIEAKPGDHLGAIQLGGTKWKWKTQRSTHMLYRGAYPDGGRFDIGNTVSDFAGGGMSIIDRHIFTNYHGEFWKNAQTGYHHHTLDNGLVVGVFGTDRTVTGKENHSAPQMAGNTLTPMAIQHPNGNLYMVHGDESDHSALHWWEISRLSTIRQQNIVINYPTQYTDPAQNFTELSVGLPFSDTLANNTAGWTKSPAFNNLTNIYTDYFKVATGVSTYKKWQPGDIHVNFAAVTNTTKTVSRALGAITATNNWRISGMISWGGEANNAGTFQYLRVLDPTGKVLARLYIQSAGSGTGTTTTIYGNGAVIATGLRTDMSLITGVSRPFSITYVGGNITFAYDNYTPVVTSLLDGTAIGLQPRTLQIYFQSVINVAAMNNKSMNLAAPRLYVDVL